MSKILITGGAGFIGYHLAKKLAEKGDEIVIATRSLNKLDKDLEDLLKKQNVKILEGDLTEKVSWKKIGYGYDYIYHLAGINGFKNFLTKPHEVLRIGIQSTLNLLDWFRLENDNQKAKVLYVSSSEVATGIPDPYEPRWSYAGQKLIGELLFIHYSKAYNFRMSIVRPNNIYGPRAGHDPMIPKFIARIKNRLEPFPIISPEENRSSCYVDDVVDAMDLVMESNKTDGQTYNVGGEKETTVMELLELMFKIAGWHPGKFDIKENPDDKSKHSLSDISKIKKDTGWTPKTLLEEGLRKTIEWYGANQLY